MASRSPDSPHATRQLACRLRGPSEVQRPQARIDGPHVPAGAELMAVFQNELGTTTSKAGTPFIAIVNEPLMTPDGQTLVRAGSELRGKVASVDRDNEPSMKLEFQTVATRL